MPVGISRLAVTGVGRFGKRSDGAVRSVLRVKDVGDLGDRSPLGWILLLMLEHQPDGPFPDLPRIPSALCHDSILSKSGASKKPGVVQTQTRPVRVTWSRKSPSVRHESEQRRAAAV